MTPAEVLGLNGEGIALSVPITLTGYELREMSKERLPYKAGVRMVLQRGSETLDLKKTLQEQGLLEDVSLTYLYLPVTQLSLAVVLLDQNGFCLAYFWVPLLTDTKF